MPTDLSDHGSSPCIAWNWSDQVVVPEYYNRILAAHSSLPNIGERILEVGVGCGYVLAHLTAGKAILGVGLDDDASSCEVASGVGQKAGSALALVRGDGRRLPFRSESFSMVFSVGVIEHFEPEVADQFLREHLRVVRRGGIVAVSVPNRWNLFHTFLKWWLGPRYRFHPERSYAPGELERLLEGHGLEIAGYEGWGLFWSLWDMPWRWSYYLSAVGFRLGLDHGFEARLSPTLRRRLGMMTMVWGRRP